MNNDSISLDHALARIRVGLSFLREHAEKLEHGERRPFYECEAVAEKIESGVIELFRRLTRSQGSDEEVRLQMFWWVVPTDNTDPQKVNRAMEVDFDFKAAIRALR